MTAAIKPFLNGARFDPRHVEAMGLAFDKVTEALDGKGESRVVREVIATKIIAIAKTGERDSDKTLRTHAERAWRHVTVAASRASPLPLHRRADIEKPATLCTSRASVAHPPEAAIITGALRTRSIIHRTIYRVQGEPITLEFVASIADQHPESHRRRHRHRAQAARHRAPAALVGKTHPPHARPRP